MAAFQNIVPYQFGQAEATNVTATLYTVPTANRAILKDIEVANTTGGALSITIYLVPSGGSAATTNALFYGVSIDANSTLQWTGTQVLHGGGFISILSSAATGLTVTASGGLAT